VTSELYGIGVPVQWVCVRILGYTSSSLILLIYGSASTAVKKGLFMTYIDCLHLY